jgi:NAD(P)-dependent dehydrogenase (short-subunit alcohol dehydrogenase family)
MRVGGSFRDEPRIADTGGVTHSRPSGDRSGRLAGKACLVTGAGSGIGRATAIRFAAEGARVAAGDIRREAAEATAQEIGDAAMALAIDVTSADSAAGAVDSVCAAFGGLDILVNNAGVTIVGAVHDLSEDEWDRELCTNLKSVYLASKAAWPKFLDRGGGAIVNTASIAGLWAIPSDAAYCASKAGVIMLTKCMALDGARSRIRVNCICPGYTQTPMIEGYFEDQQDPVQARRLAEDLHPLGRLGQPEDIASAMVYLASEEAGWVTGTALVVDGGLTSGIWA